jgi:serine/threonine-protein kinase
MSPEQVANGRTIDRRSDIYSLGAVAYFLLAGAPPFVRATSVEVLMAHLHELPEPLNQRCLGISTDIEAIVLRCLEKDPAQRFQSAEAVVDSLCRCADSVSWTGEQAADWWRQKEPGHDLKHNPSAGTRNV